MNPVILKRLCSFDILCLKKVIQCTISHPYSSKPKKRDKTSLDAVVSSIFRYMKEQMKLESLVVLDNPASGDVVRKFKKAGVEKVVCTIKEEDHFLKIQKDLWEMKQNVFHYDLLAVNRRGTMKLSKCVEIEEEILSSMKNISGVVILASGVSDQETMEPHRKLLNRTMTREAVGFCRHQIDWFITLPEHTRKHFQSKHSVVRIFNTFYDHQTGIAIKYGDTSLIFHTNLNSKIKKLNTVPQSKVKHLRKISVIKQNDVRFVHFKTNHDLLKELSLDERQAYKTFMRSIVGPQRLIPALEKTVPGCGLGLIELGYGMADEFQQIPDKQCLQVYKDVKSLPEYEGSALQYQLAGKSMLEVEEDAFYNEGPWWFHGMKNEPT